MRNFLCTWLRSGPTFGGVGRHCVTGSRPTEFDAKGTTMKNRIVTTYRAWRKYRQTYNELMRLSTRDLADLGINPGDIPEIARKSASL